MALPPVLRARRRGVVSPLAVVAAVALVGLLGLPAPMRAADAQEATAGAPLGLSAPSWLSPEVPAELRISSLWVLPGPDGAPSAVDVRFAGAFTPPPGRWRVSVGVGDPAGAWQRVSMVWDGSVASGVAQQIEGLEAAELGPVSASVDPSGSVVVGVPAGVLDASGGGVVWAEAILGEDPAPTLLVRTPWFPRAVLAGEGAPGLLQGSTLGLVVPPAPGGPSDSVTPAVVDTGVPSVLELAGGVLTIDRGAGPAADAGDVSSVVDLVTLVGVPATPESPATGPQVRVDLVGGGVDLGSGSVLGPLGPVVGDGAVVGASSAWLPDAGADGSLPPSGPVQVDVAGAFAELGQSDPGASLAVSVTRVLTLTDGTLVAAPGVVGDASWLQPGGETAATPPVTAVPERVADDSGAPVIPIVVGAVLGLVLVGGAMVFADSLHRRRHPGPDDNWSPPRAAPPADAGAGSPPPPAPETSPQPPQASAPDPSPEPPPTPTPPPAPDPAPDPVPAHETSESPGGPDAQAPDGAAGGRSGASLPGVAGLDDDLEALTERLRRLGSEE